jgi:ADP-heptose:LPS heptosyltransferase
MTGFRHILVIRLSAMGDVAMTVPVIRALLNQYPDLKVTVLTRKQFNPIFRSIPGVEIYTADLKGKHRGVFGLYQLSRSLKKLKIDAVADLHNVLRTKILRLFFMGTPFYSIDKGRAEKKALLSGQLFEPLKTTHQRYAEVFAQLGYDVNLENPVFPKPIDLNQSKVFKHLELKRPLIGIAPFAAHQGKMYPLQLMEEVIAQLSNNYQIVLFGGGKMEAKALSRIEKQFANVVSVAGKMSLNEELALISNLDLMISMDSGNGHLAAIYGIKVLTIWGVTHPFAGFAPYQQGEGHQLLADRQKYPLIPTSIYGNKCPEGYEQASASIPPSRIVEKATTILS